MPTYVQIANVALQHIGEGDRITAPDEASKPARAIKAAWDLTRLFVLSEAHWAFALRTLELTARSADPLFPIALGRNAFPMPADLVELVEIVTPCLDDESDSYSIERGPNGTELLTDDPGPITIRYVRDNEAIADPTSWPPAFVEAFAWHLAWQISEELAADKARKDRAQAAAIAALRKAKRANTRTKSPRAEATTPWTSARQGGFLRYIPGTR